MSGLLAGFLGGVAKGGLGIIDQQEKQQAELEKEERVSARQMQLEEVRAQIEMRRQAYLDELKARREEQAKKKDATDAVTAEANAESTLSNRGFDKFKADLGQTDASDEDLRKVYDSQYHDKKVGDFQGADRYDVKESDRARTTLREAQKLGASGGLINQFNAQVKDAVAGERFAVDTDLKERRLQQTERNNEANREIDRARLEQSQARLEAYIAKSSAGGGGGSEKDAMRGYMSLLQQQRTDNNNKANNIRQLMIAEMNQAGTKAARAAVQEKYAPQIAELESRNQQLDADFDFVRDKLGMPSRTQAPKAETPAPAPSPVNQNGGQSTKPKTAPKPPAVGTVKGGYRFKGGDPSKPESWEKV